MCHAGRRRANLCKNKAKSVATHAVDSSIARNRTRTAERESLQGLKFVLAFGRIAFELRRLRRERRECRCTSELGEQQTLRGAKISEVARAHLKLLKSPVGDGFCTGSSDADEQQQRPPISQRNTKRSSRQRTSQLRAVQFCSGCLRKLRLCLGWRCRRISAAAPLALLCCRRFDWNCCCCRCQRISLPLPLNLRANLPFASDPSTWRLADSKCMFVR